MRPGPARLPAPALPTGSPARTPGGGGCSRPAPAPRRPAAALRRCVRAWAEGPGAAQGLLERGRAWGLPGMALPGAEQLRARRRGPYWARRAGLRREERPETAHALRRPADPVRHASGGRAKGGGGLWRRAARWPPGHAQGRRALPRPQGRSPTGARRAGGPGQQARRPGAPAWRGRAPTASRVQPRWVTPEAGLQR